MDALATVNCRNRWRDADDHRRLLVNAHQRSERRDVVRSKLEEIYLLSGTLVEWAEATHAQAVGIALKLPSTKEVPPAPIDDLLMRARFYEPRLRGAVEALIKRADDVSVAANSFYDYFGSKPYGDEVDAARMQPLVDARDALIESREALVKELEVVVRHYT